MKLKKIILPTIALAATFGLGTAYHVVTSQADTNTIQVTKDSLPVNNATAATPIPTPDAVPTTDTATTTAPATSQPTAADVVAPVDTSAPAAAATPKPTPTWNSSVDTNPEAPMGLQPNGTITSN